MCWNAQVYDILTTASGFVFLCRNDIGDLWISQMFASNETLGRGGYVLPSSLSQTVRFTISHVLYWFSHLSETTERIIEKDLAQSIRVMDSYLIKPAESPSPNITFESFPSLSSQPSNTGTGGFQGCTFILSTLKMVATTRLCSRLLFTLPATSASRRL
jgi:hypothetical protein